MNYFESRLNSLLLERNETKNRTVDAPSNKKPIDGSFTVFLAGTIDCDNGSEDWQHKLCDMAEADDSNGRALTIYNPRRKEFTDNSSSAVRKQIKWEHEHMDDVDLIVMNLLDNSKSPISLMEIGMYAESGKLVVFCTDKFYRYDNVEMVCKKYNVPLHNTTDVNDIYKEIKKRSDKKIAESHIRKIVGETLNRMVSESKSNRYVNMDVDLPNADRVAPKMSKDEFLEKMRTVLVKLADDDEERGKLEKNKINPSKIVSKIYRSKWNKDASSIVSNRMGT